MDGVPLREHVAALRQADQRAVDAALDAAKEKSASHNDPIRAMERQQSTFVPRLEFEPVRRFAYMVLGVSVAMPILVGIVLALVLR